MKNYKLHYFDLSRFRGMLDIQADNYESACEKGRAHLEDMGGDLFLAVDHGKILLDKYSPNLANELRRTMPRGA